MQSSTEQPSGEILTLWSYDYIEKGVYISKKTALEQSSGAKKLIFTLYIFQGFNSISQ